MAKQIITEAQQKLYKILKQRQSLETQTRLLDYSKHNHEKTVTEQEQILKLRELVTDVVKEKAKERESGLCSIDPVALFLSVIEAQTAKPLTNLRGGNVHVLGINTPPTGDVDLAKHTVCIDMKPQDAIMIWSRGFLTPMTDLGNMLGISTYDNQEAGVTFSRSRITKVFEKFTKAKDVDKALSDFWAARDKEEMKSYAEQVKREKGRGSAVLG